jgi:ubiquitin-conjugating enzyme E2 variant
MNWYIAFFLCYASLSNQIHAIAHAKQKNKIIILFQKIGLIQSKEMHDLHHTSPYDINYCVMTNYLNPFLTYINFWYKLENVLSLFGINTTRGLSIRKGV